MKNIILIVAFFIIQQGLYGQIVPRDILAAQGAPGNSYNWNPEINNMKADGYQIRPAFSIDYFSQSVTIAENVTKFDAGINLPIHNYTNVLGLGHDTGGLAIRGLKAQNDKITG